MGRIRRYIARYPLRLLSIILLVATWELSSRVVSNRSEIGSAIPSLTTVFTTSFLRLSDYWYFNILAPVPAQGGDRTIAGAVLALLFHTGISLVRLAAGLLVGAILGTILGICLSASRSLRTLSTVPLYILQMTPMLALIPIFQFWFGISNISAIMFISYGVAVPFLISTINAVRNVSIEYREYAMTLGASRRQLYQYVILPAIMPDLFSALTVCVGVGWSLLIGAEYIGVESGIGRMVIWANMFSDTSRMVLVSIVIAVVAALTNAIVRAVRRRILVWS